MNILNRLFGNNSEKSELSKEKKEVMVNVTSIAKNKIPSNTSIISESQIPAYCSIGNLVFEKKYHEALEIGKILLTETPESAGVHVNLMDVYFKIKDENPIYYEKHIEHARFAMLFGHNTGYVQKKLAIGLEKQKKIFQAIQICDIVLNDKFNFSSHGCGNKDEFVKRKEKLLKNVHKSLDSCESKVFSKNEISHIIKQVRQQEEQAKLDRIEYEKIMKNFKY